MIIKELEVDKSVFEQTNKPVTICLIGICSQTITEQ
jgi:hypothetical protein